MRNFIIGFITCVLLLAAVPAFADSISRVGKKVGAEAELYLDGKRMSDVVVIEGNSYAPLREIAEALGRSVNYKAASKDQKAVVSLSASQFAQEQRIKDINLRIGQIESQSERIQQSKVEYVEFMKKHTGDPLSEEALQLISESEQMKDAEIAKLEEELQGLKKELEALEFA